MPRGGGFEPTEEQKQNVVILVGLGVPQEQIRYLIRRPDGKPIDVKTLRKRFKEELTLGEVRLKSQVGNFMLATIFGRDVPAGTKKIESDLARNDLLKLFLKSRCGFTERTVLEGNKDRPVFIYQPTKTDERL